MTDMFRIFAGLSMSARISHLVSHLSVTERVLGSSRLYLFHGEAVRDPCVSVRPGQCQMYSSLGNMILILRLKDSETNATSRTSELNGPTLTVGPDSGGTYLTISAVFYLNNY